MKATTAQRLDVLQQEGLASLFPKTTKILVGAASCGLAAGAGALWLIQLLWSWEAEPTQLGGRRLIDIEGGAQTDMLINRRNIDTYKLRLQRLQEGLMRAARRAHARFVVLTADRGLATLCREELVAAEMLRLT